MKLVLILSLLWIQPALSSSHSASRCVKQMTLNYGADWTIRIPKTLAPQIKLIRSQPKIVKAKLIQSGFKPEIAERMIQNEEPFLPFFLAQDLEIVRPQKTVVDRTRYRRTYSPKKDRVAGGFEPITVYRGVSLREKNQKINTSPKEMFKDDYQSVGHVIWVTDVFHEAQNYGKYGSYVTSPKDISGYVLEFQIPALLFYQRQEYMEGFIHPEMLSHLESYLVGAHSLKITPAEYGMEDWNSEYFSYDLVETKPERIKTHKIPFKDLVNKVFIHE